MLVASAPVSAPPPETRCLMAFVTSSCEVCATAWEMMGALAARADGAGGQSPYQLVIVTPSRSMEDERAVLALAPPGVQVHMGSETWFSYGITQAGTFVLAEQAQGAPAPWLEPGRTLGSAVPGDMHELRAFLRKWLGG